MYFLKIINITQLQGMKYCKHRCWGDIDMLRMIITHHGVPIWMPRAKYLQCCDTKMDW